MRVSANQVSVVNASLGVLAALSYSIGTTFGVIGGTALFTLNSILDGVDGEIARYYRKSSLNGLFMDRMNSIFLYPLVFAGMCFGILRRDPTLYVAAIGMVAIWASGAIRLAKTTADSTIVDALTLSKAKKEASDQPGGTYVPLSEVLRADKKWYLMAVDFVLVRQPGINILLVIATLAQVLALNDAFRVRPELEPFALVLAFYAVAFGGGVVYGLFHILRSKRIEAVVVQIQEKFSKGS